jgi:ADP-ribose 1''-phosphate phosphatase
MAKRRRDTVDVAGDSSVRNANNRRKQPRGGSTQLKERGISRDDGHLPVQEFQNDESPTAKAENAENQNLEQHESESSKPKFKVVEHEGDIFDAPDNAVLIHACNCIGSWGGGIAAAFKERYPEAFDLYQQHCKDSTPAKLIGTALLIPPSEEDGPKHWVGCVFTSKKFGKARDSPQQILRNTQPAMEDLIEQIAQTVKSGGAVSEIRICYINSGLFRVPWERSKAIIEDIKISDDLNVHEISAWVPAKDSEKPSNT